MNLQELYRALCARFPEEDRASFDLDGLQLAPDLSREVKTILTALDVTRESVAAAKEIGADLLLTHHPILFSGVRTLDPTSSMDAENATALLTGGIAHISLHTRFDAGKGGINDTLARKLGLTDICIFGTEEDPALGRRGVLKEPMSSEDFARFVADTLGTHVLLTKGRDTVETVAVVGGAAGDFLDAFTQTNLDALVTGEVAHHRRLLASHAHKTLLEASHYGSEILFCEAIQTVLGELPLSAKIVPFINTPHEICISTSN